MTNEKLLQQIARDRASLHDDVDALCDVSIAIVQAGGVDDRDPQDFHRRYDAVQDIHARVRQLATIESRV